MVVTKKPIPVPEPPAVFDITELTRDEMLQLQTILGRGMDLVNGLFWKVCKATGADRTGYRVIWDDGVLRIQKG